MKRLFQHASRSLFANVVPVASQRVGNAKLNSFLRSASNMPLICLSCRFRAASVSLPPRVKSQTSYDTSPSKPLRRQSRQFSSTGVRNEKEKPSESTEDPTNTSHGPHSNESPSTLSQALPSSRVKDDIKRVPAEDLPSHREGQRWDLSKRFSEMMDELLPKIAVVTQKVNTYTGTDYSGIEALRTEIKEQEQLVKARRHAIDTAKQALDAALAQQSSAQKEVVALLERKHSWSATDLERYMSLIRSEHVNDQAVREAKEAVLSAETVLEESRSRLEKRERAQYHEEQIWSDTIRRNSTWVTFGLMGVNIFLLLASLIAIEPWRRRRMVKEIKNTLEAQKPTMPALESAPTSQPTAAIEAAIDSIVESAGQPAKDIAGDAPETPLTPDSTPSTPVPEVLRGEPAKNVNPYETANPVTEPLTPPSLEQAETVAAMDIKKEVEASMTWWERLTDRLQGLKSEEPMSIRKKDLTTAVVASAALGWFAANIVSLIFNWPH